LFALFNLNHSANSCTG